MLMLSPRSCRFLHLPDNFFEALGRNPPIDLVIDHHRGRTGAVAEAIDRLERKRTVMCGFVEIHAQLCLGVLDQLIGAHRLTGFRATEINRMTSRRRRAEVVIETDHAMDFCPRQIECLRNLRDGLAGHIAESILNAMQNRQQSSRPIFSLFEYAAYDHRVPVLPRIRHHASLGSPLERYRRFPSNSSTASYA